MVNYILVNNKYRSSVKDVKKIPGGKMTQHLLSTSYLLLMDMVFKKKARRKIKFRKKLELWMLRVSGERRVC